MRAALTQLGRSRRAPVLVMVLILLFSVVTALIIATFAREQQRSRFERETQVVTATLRDRLLDYDRLLRSARAAWQANPSLLNEAQFVHYAEGVELARRYPGVQAIGFGTWLPDGNAADLIERERRGGQAQYSVRQGASPQRAKAPISVIAPPNAENVGALGFDLYSDALRREAMQDSLKNDQVQATRRLHLVQKDAEGHPLSGFLLMLPVWLDVQRQQLQGFMYVAVRADQFLSDLGTTKTSGPLLFQVQLAGEPLNNVTFAADLPFQTAQPLNLAGRSWQLMYGAPEGYAQDFAASVPVIMLLAGMLSAGLAFMVVKAQVDARERAEGLNVSLGQARLKQEQSRAEFEAIFQSMQDAAAFTDAEGKVRMVNRALTDQFRVEPGQLIGQPLAALHLDDRLAGRDTFQLLTTPYQRHDGTQFSGEAQRSEVFDPQGQRLGLLEVVRDVTERVNAERAVQAGEQRYRGVLDAVPHILQVSDPEGQVTYLNAQHQQLLGVPDMTGRMQQDDLATYRQLWERAQGGQQGASGELQLTLQGGQRRWFVLRISPLRDSQGNVLEWVTSATDIHDRLLAERSAQRNQERYRGVLEGLPQIVWVTDPQGQAVYFNRRWNDYVGQERAAGGFQAQLHPEDRAAYAQRWEQALSGARFFEAEHRLLGQDGTYRAFVTRGLPVLDAQGQVIEWIGTSTDVDDSVYAENAARLLAEVTDSLAARIGPGLQGRTRHYQAALTRIASRFADSAALWTVNPQALVATSQLHASWETSHMRAAAESAVRRVVETLDPVFIPSHPILHSVDATGALLYPLLGRGGELIGVLGLAYRQALTDRDQDLAQELAHRFASALVNDQLAQQVTAAQADLLALNQSLEERVQRRTNELEATNRELEAFSYSVSHDLRSPLRHIVGFGDLLHKEAAGQLSSKGQRYLGIMTESAGRMSQLIDDLLEFSRMGRQELHAGEVNLHELLGSSWQALEPDRQGRQIDFRLDGQWPVIQGDARLLGLVFTNLLSNAIKYTRTREQAVIRVNAHLEGLDIVVDVQDNGVGFDPKYADKLFGVFQRLHRADEFEGIGIGLANVRRIIARHGGQVSASAELNRGATFRVTLPVQGRSVA